MQSSRDLATSFGVVRLRRPLVYVMRIKLFNLSVFVSETRSNIFFYTHDMRRDLNINRRAGGEILRRLISLKYFLKRIKK